MLIDKEDKILFRLESVSYHLQSSGSMDEFMKLVKYSESTKTAALAANNPTFSDSANVKRDFAMGVRNPQGLAFHPQTGELWESVSMANVRGRRKLISSKQVKTTVGPQLLMELNILEI
ncbi:MAG: PQQ-dependent sugar dehydrogenase [Spirosomataceae bacterium]